MKKTAKQLAEELGVSATTVSLAFGEARVFPRRPGTGCWQRRRPQGWRYRNRSRRKICNTAGLRYDLLGLYRKDSILSYILTRLL